MRSLLRLLRRLPASKASQEQVTNSPPAASTEVQSDGPTFIRHVEPAAAPVEQRARIRSWVSRWWATLWRPTRTIVNGRADEGRDGFAVLWLGRVSDLLERWFGKKRLVAACDADDNRMWHRPESLMLLEKRSAPGAVNLAAAMPMVIPSIGSLGQDRPALLRTSTLDRIDAAAGEQRVLRLGDQQPKFIRPEEEAPSASNATPGTGEVTTIVPSRLDEEPFASPLDPDQLFDTGLGSAGTPGSAPTPEAEAEPESGGGGGGSSGGSTDLELQASGGSGGASMSTEKNEAQQLADLINSGAFDTDLAPFASAASIGQPSSTQLSAEAQAEILENIARLPMRFEEHTGPDGTYYFARGAGYGIYVTPTEATLGLVSYNASNQDRTPIDPFAETELPTPEVHTLSLQIVGGNPNASPVAQEAQPGTVNYLMGDDPSAWRTNVTTYGNVLFQQVYDGIDLIYYGTDQRELQFDFVVAPGANPDNIRFTFAGADQVELAEDGSLLLHTAGGTLVQKAPLLYQEVNGLRQRVSGNFVLHNDGTIGFNVGTYDRTKELTIDPVLSYVSYLGGNGADTVSAVRAGSDGSAYVTGWTTSTNLPVIGGSGGSPFQSSKATSYDAFVAKVAPDGSSLVYLTYLGGNSLDFAYAIDVDSSGNAYIAGGTNSTNFPVSGGAYDTTHNGSRDAFVFKLSADGQSRVWATYVGASGNDQANSIVVDENDEVIIAGATSSSGFPTLRALDSTLNGASDAFVTRLNSSGTALVYSTLYGGSNGEAINGLALDSSGNVIVAGHTDSSDLTTKNAAQGTFGGATDMFLAKIVDPGSPSAVTLDYATYLGGSGVDVAEAVAVDGNDQATIVGFSAAYSSTNDFPVLNSLQAFQGGSLDYSDAIVARFSATGSKEFATYLGGTGDDYGRGIDVDEFGNYYMIGETYSSDIETVNAFDDTYSGMRDAFVTFLDVNGNDVVMQSYLGGTNVDTGIGIAYGAGSVFAVGDTYGSFPTTMGAFQTTFGGGLNDGFVTKLAATRVTIEATTPDAFEVGDIPGVFTVTRTGDLSSALTVNYRISGNATPGDDYTALTGTVVIAATQATATIVVDPIQDNMPEVDERVIARLEPSPDYFIGSPASATVTIHDTTVSIEAIDNTAEGSMTPGKFRISRTGPNIGDLTVYYTFNGTALPGFDYDRIADSVVITNGNSSVDVLIDAIDDSDIEGTETVMLTLFQDPLYAIDPSAASDTITITDNDSTDQWPMEAFILNWDPLTGQGVQQTGNNQVSYAVDLDQSPGIVQGGNSYLVYNSDFVDVRPIVQATIISDVNAPVPDQITVELSWDGTPQGSAKTFSTAGFIPGTPFTVAFQVDDPVGATGRYDWEITVTVDYPGVLDDIERI
ncbi:MAG: SBBP repeat-containing protein, partial [Gemmataceae bacterium]